MDDFEDDEASVKESEEIVRNGGFNMGGFEDESNWWYLN